MRTVYTAAFRSARARSEASTRERFRRTGRAAEAKRRDVEEGKEKGIRNEEEATRVPYHFPIGAGSPRCRRSDRFRRSRNTALGSSSSSSSSTQQQPQTAAVHGRRREALFGRAQTSLRTAFSCTPG